MSEYMFLLLKKMLHLLFILAMLLEMFVIVVSFFFVGLSIYIVKE